VALIPKEGGEGLRVRRVVVDDKNAGTSTERGLHAQTFPPNQSSAGA